MAEKKISGPNPTTHDFFKDKQRQYFVFGFAQSNHIAYSIYRIAIVLFMVSLSSLAIYGAILVPSKKLRVDAAHYCLLAWHAIFGLVARILTNRALNKTQTILQYGIYHYRDEEVDEEELKMKEGIPKEVRKKFNFFLSLCICGLVSNQIFYPISQLVNITEEDFVVPDEWFNPYLPHLLFMPFSTRTVHGYWFTHILDSMCYCCLYYTTLCICLIFISCEVQLKIHLQVLSHSLKNIQKRAFNRYKKIVHISPDEMSQGYLLQNKIFQSCLHSCLRSNIRHHQSLIRLLKEIEPFIGLTLLVFFTLDATIRATVLFSILQKPRINYLLNYVLTFAAESAYSYQICTFGEELISESNNLYNTVYSIPWFLYGKPFNRTLHILMSNIQKPIQFKAMAFGITASLDTYGTLFSGMYKMTNVVMQSDVL